MKTLNLKSISQYMSFGLGAFILLSATASFGADSNGFELSLTAENQREMNVWMNHHEQLIMSGRLSTSQAYSFHEQNKARTLALIERTEGDIAHRQVQLLDRRLQENGHQEARTVLGVMGVLGGLATGKNYRMKVASAEVHAYTKLVDQDRSAGVSINESGFEARAVKSQSGESKVGLSRKIPGLEITSAVDYSTASGVWESSIGKSITDQVSATLYSSANEGRVAVHYGLQF